MLNPGTCCDRCRSGRPLGTGELSRVRRPLRRWVPAAGQILLGRSAPTDRVVATSVRLLDQRHGGDLLPGEQLPGPHSDRLGRSAGREHHEVVLEYLRVDEHLAAQQGSQRGQGAQLVAGEVAGELLLAGQAA
jgi:hypothetical protein